MSYCHTSTYIAIKGHPVLYGLRTVAVVYRKHTAIILSINIIVKKQMLIHSARDKSYILPTIFA